MIEAMLHYDILKTCVRMITFDTERNYVILFGNLKNLNPRQLLFSLSPYFAVIIGLYIFHHAWLAIILYHVFILIFITYSAPKINLRQEMSYRNLPILVSVSVICLLSGPIIYLLWDYIKLPHLTLASSLSYFGLHGLYKTLFIIYFSLIHPVVEELFWRVKIQDDGHLLSIYDILFAGYHLLVLRFFIKPPFLILTFLSLITISAIWRYLHNHLQERLSVYLSHAIADFSIIATTFFLS